MEKFKDKILEIEQSVEVVRQVVLGLVDKMKNRGDIGGRKWIMEDLEQLLGLLNKYVDLLIKLKREFGDVFEEQVDEVTELLWDIRLLDESNRLKVKELVKEIIKSNYAA